MGPESMSSERGPLSLGGEKADNLKPPPSGNVWALKVHFPLSIVTRAT